MAFVRAAQKQNTTDSQLSFVATIERYGIGDLLLLLAVREGAGGSNFTVSGSWTEITVPDQTPGNSRCGIWYKTAVANEPDVTITGTVSDTWSALVISIGEADTTNPINAIATDYNNKKFATSPALTTTANNCLVINSTFAQFARYYNPAPGFMGKVSAVGSRENIGFCWTTQEQAGATRRSDWYMTYFDTRLMLSLAINDAGGGHNKPVIDHASDLVTPLQSLPSSSLYPLGSRTNNAASLIPTIEGLPLTGFSLTQNAAGVGVTNENGAIRLGTGSGNDSTKVNSMYFTIPTSFDYTGKLLAYHFNNDDVQRTNWSKYLGIVDVNGNYKVFKVATPTSTPDKQSYQVILIDPASNIGVTDSSGTLDITQINRYVLAVRDRVTRALFVASQFHAVSVASTKGGSEKYPANLQTLSDGLASASTLLMQTQRDQTTSQFLSYSGLKLVGPFVVDGSSLAFPEGRDGVTRYQVNIPDNKLGLELSATINSPAVFRNCTVSSGQPFYFKLKGQGGWNLSGTQIINAGFFDFDNVGQVAELTLNNCVTAPSNFDYSGGCTFKATKTYAIEIASQADLDNIANCIFDENPVAIKVTLDSGDLYAQNIKFNDNTVDLEFTGTGTVRWINDRTSNAQTLLSSGPGTHSIETPATPISIKCISGGQPVENAVVYLEAVAGGPKPVGEVLINATTNAAGEVSTQVDINADQPYRGTVSKGSQAPYYVRQYLSGTLRPLDGINQTIQLIPE